jgi:hypothetical protein
MEKTAVKFRDFSAAEKSDREFYRKLSGPERLDILLQLRSMSLSADLRELIELLNSRGVEYVIVGAHSLAFHGRPRYTGDLEILLRPSPENAEKVASALPEFGFADFGPSDSQSPIK